MIKSIPYFLVFFLFFARAMGSDQRFLSTADTTKAQADSILRVIYYQALSEYDSGRYENAGQLYPQVVHLIETYSPHDSARLAIVYTTYGRILTSLWRNDEALSFYDKAIDFTPKTSNEDFALALVRKGISLAGLRDFTSALKFYEQAEKISLQPNNLNAEALKHIYTNKSLAFQSLNRYEESLTYLNIIESLPRLSDADKDIIARRKFFLYYTSMDSEKAEKLYKDLISNDLPSQTKFSLDFLYGIYLYVKKQKIDDAIKVFESLDSDLNEFSLSKLETLRYYNNLGNCYDLVNMRKKALDTYQKCLITLYPEFTSTDIKTDPPIASTYEEAQNLRLFRNKAEVLYKYSKITHDTSYLSSSLFNSLRSVNAIQKMRYRITSDQSQFLIAKDERNSFNLAQYIALERYTLTKDKYYLNLAFKVNEKGRSFTLLSAIRSQEAMDFGDVPPSVRKQEDELNRQLSLYDELLYNEKQKAEPNPGMISSWEDQLFKASNDYTGFLRKIEREYPEYYRLKFEDDVTDLYDIQDKIDKNTVLVEYSYMDSILIIYTASRKKMSATRVDLKPGFEDKCIEFLNLITTQSFSNNASAIYDNYITLAHELFTVLILPIKEQLDGENLIVIPDGAISYIPFDALLTAEVPGGVPDYRHIPYLVREYSVGYSYSTTIHFNPLKHVKIPSENILAFAPIYSKSENTNKASILLRSQDLIDLITLPGVTIEVNNISNLLKTDAYYNVAAKESVFKRLAGKYNVLHLAMHTMIDNNDPMLSSLIFTQVPDGNEDGLLHTYEIYNMKLNARMTVLSSCSSGYGKIQPGEGVQSLARGFAYAGCPSILMTLWEVGDYSAALLMTDFYKYLKDHRTKPQALRESKMNFINFSDELRANPYFWASYVVIGDSSPLYPFRNDMATLSGFLLLLPLGFLGMFYRSYTKEEKNRKKRVR